MTVRTLHVYREDGGWIVKKMGQSARVFRTQREAVAAAKSAIRHEKVGQFVIHGKDGAIRGYGAYGMPRIQDPPKKSRNAHRISQVVGQAALDQLRSDGNTTGDRSPQK